MFTEESWGTEKTQREEESRKRKIISLEKEKTDLLDNLNNFSYNQIFHILINIVFIRHLCYFINYREVLCQGVFFSLQFD